jgi:hypothetical protein
MIRGEADLYRMAVDYSRGHAISTLYLAIYER